MSSAFTISIDARPVEVRPGESVLTAARRLAIDIPTLCYLEKCGPLNSCQVCLVKLNGKLVPSCGTKVVLRLVVQSIAITHSSLPRTKDCDYGRHSWALRMCHHLRRERLHQPVRF